MGANKYYLYKYTIHFLVDYNILIDKGTWYKSKSAGIHSKQKIIGIFEFYPGQNPLQVIPVLKYQINLIIKLT